jgi:Icc-related predicted phosphoesterase
MRKVVRLAAIADVHCSRASRGTLEGIFADAAEQADVLLIGGDLTDHGLPEEARILARELAGASRVPAVAVLGNHDFESEQSGEVERILSDAGIVVLDGEAYECLGIGIAGVKGFAGGFGAHALGSWGEGAIKAFVREAVDEALKLERALAKLGTAKKVVLLHYSPIRQTAVGEAEEIFPFLGSSRLEEPLSRYPLAAVFHGHAHRGSLEGRTRMNVPVYNVALPLLERAFPGRSPFRVVEIEAES